MGRPEKRKTFRIQGLDCAEEVRALKKTVGALPGVDDLQFDVLGGRMTVNFNPERLSEDDIRRGVVQAGLGVIPENNHGPAGFWQNKGRLVLCSASGVFLLGGFLLHALLHGGLLDALVAGEGGEAHTIPVVSMALYLLSVLAGGWFVVPKALSSARRLSADMNLLMAVAVAGALAIGEWFEAGAVTFLFSLSLVLESWSVGRARRAIGKLMDLSPTIARCICPHHGDVEEKPVEAVPVGATVLVRPGEKVPLDGTVSKGRTTINESPITGESMPAEKGEGDTVFAGTINEESAFQFTVTKAASDSTLARIIRMVEEAQGRRANAEQWVDTFARCYTPAMMALAVVVALAPPLLFGGNWGAWFYQALVMLVIACPCALVISTPVTIVAGLASAARAGVLIKGGLFLEAPAGLRAVALDKTGTLTHGTPEVQAVHPFNGHTEDEVLARAAALESESGHPIARAVGRAAAARGVDFAPAHGVRDIKGKGAEATINGKDYWIGSHRFMHEKGAETPDIHARAVAIEDAAHTLVALGSEEHVCGLIAVADGVRPQARHAIHALREAGIEHIAMLTGDNRATASAVAAAVGIDHFRAELLPHEKVEAVEELAQRYGTVAMIGDGVNDAPAMAAASLAIAMGVAGTDSAIETADVALMSDDLSKLPWLILHSRRTLAVIKQNVMFALATKALFMILALFGVATLWMAIAADTGASLLVVFNGLRMLRRR
ncbi:MAG: heavy metal translocating P-type ATPase [Lentisphaeria bacterium]|jgi:Cd2+/Zn2+-exporting ATPase|nr:heavy metal translocating P-type ATPase [Lentisphaeria bacterium]